MAESTGIGWADATFNGWVGCSKVSPGCAHCYAETLVTGRMGRAGTWGDAGVRERTSASNWKKPERWQRLAEQGRLPDGSENRDGHRPRVFCSSLADVFEPRPELDPWRRDLFGLIETTPALDWLLLTKRPEEARDWLGRYYDCDHGGGPTYGRCPHCALLPNVWVGVSIENARFTWRADVLREIPAAVRFISAEPLLGSLYRSPHGELPLRKFADSDYPYRRLDLAGIDWLIVGDESGSPKARPMHPDWPRELRDACLDAPYACDYCRIGRRAPSRDGCATHWAPCERPTFFFKQWGSWRPSAEASGAATFLGYDGQRLGRLGLDAMPDELLEPVYRMVYAGAGPTSGGALLDGRAWHEFPDPTGARLGAALVS